MCVGTRGSAGFAGASAWPSLGACSLVCSRMATSRSSSRMGGKPPSPPPVGSTTDTDESVVSVDMKSGAGQRTDRDAITHRLAACGDETKACACVDDAAASARAMRNLMLIICLLCG